MSKQQQQSKTPKLRAKKNVQKSSSALAKDRLVYKVPLCSEHYFDALCNPFSVPPGVCIPCDLFPIPSLKVKTFIRSTLKLSTTGAGFIMFNPPIVNDQACTAYSTSTSVGTTSTEFTNFTNTGGLSMSQLPYSTAQVDADLILGRVVAAGIRVKYVGKFMDMNGVCVSFEDPDHRDVSAQSFDSLSSNMYTTINRVSNGETWDKSVCLSGPTSPDQLEFTDNYFPVGFNDTGGTPLVVAISGIAGDIYEFECFQHTEFIGSIVVGKTKSHADANAFGKVLETVKTATVDRPLEPYMAPTLWETFKKNLLGSLPSLASGASAVVNSVFEMNPSKLIEGYHGIEKGFSNLLGDYGTYKYNGQLGYKSGKVLALPEPSYHLNMDRRTPIPVVLPSRVEVVDEETEKIDPEIQVPSFPITLRQRQSSIRNQNLPFQKGKQRFLDAHL